MGSEFVLTEAQEEFGSVLRSFFQRKTPVEIARQHIEAGQRYDTDLWRDFAEQLGLLGLVLPERFGGSEASRVELAIAGEEMGRVLLGGPFLSTVVMAAEAVVASGDEAAARDILPRIVDGGTTATLAVVEADGRWSVDSIHARAEGSGTDLRVSGTKEFVLDGADADALIVAAHGRAGLSLYLINADDPGVERVALETLDLTRPMARVQLRGVSAQPLGTPGQGWPVIARVLENMAIFLAAEQVGGSQACVDLTADYARNRVQFGHPIGRFQGVKHRLADMALRLELSRSASQWAAWQPAGSTDAAFGAAIAGSYCSEAYLQTALDTVQLHGGLGFTWEHDAHLFVRRARADYSLADTPVRHRQNLERYAHDFALQGAAA